MISSFLNFTRVKQVVYVFIVELLVFSVVALIANSNIGFATKILNIVYKPVFLMSEKYQKILLQECHELLCMFPDPTRLGLALTISISVLVMILVAYIIILLMGIVAKEKQID